MRELTGAAVRRLWIDPRTKLLLLFIINVVMMGGAIDGIAVVVRPVLAFIPFILLLSEGKIKAAGIYFILFAFSAFGEAYMVPRTTGLANLLVIIVSGLVARFMPCLVMGYYVVTTTTVSEFTASMERMHVTPKIIIPLSVMFRFFPTVMEEAHAISDSMKMRGIGGSSVIKNPIKSLEYRVVPLIACVVKIGEELSAAALTRGLGGPVKRTNICRIGFGGWDIMLSIAALSAAACMMIL
ncbi:energy-coupling factor transporter transmembrane component T [Sedimentibacter sp.]|uniref:energy-coupling factor transporter transmembrane component T n=1 Tax=Sedimentibacter sp. TaxID=1960295 RepID=UPI0028A5A2CB|nr:energy-coupling factor transporter transmembrane component T [Sedimentibacter sp.]